jgi:lipid A Kdo2 1-phosphate O-methyltransferase
MALIEEFDQQGSFLFRWRSYVPGFILLFLLILLPETKYLEGSHDKQLYFGGFCFWVSLVGLLIRCLVIGYAPARTSGRNTKDQIADLVNKTGIYSTLRHPLYLGNFLMYLGLVIYVHNLYFVLLYCLFFATYYERIMFTEEYFLRNKFGDEYLSWANKTPAFIPSFKNFVPPNLSFSLKNILKREYPSLFGMIFFFTLIDLIMIYYNDFVNIGLSSPMELVQLVHIIFFGIGFVFYTVTRILVKFTKILNVEGR